VDADEEERPRAERRRVAWRLVGAVRYLYSKSIHPLIIVGNSVGAINGAKLAEGEDAANPKQGLPDLLRIWRGLRFDSDM